MDGSPSARITEELLTWPGVTAGPHRFGGVEFHLGRRELGHLHGDRVADLPFRRERRDELIAAGRARVHRWLPDSGWVTVSLEGEDAVDDVIALLRESYDSARSAAERRARS